MMTRATTGDGRPDHAASATFAAWGSLAGVTTATGARRIPPARASAPATTSLPGEIAAGSTPDVVDCLITSGLPAALPSTPWILGQGGPQLTAAAGEDPERPTAAVLQPGGVA